LWGKFKRGTAKAVPRFIFLAATMAVSQKIRRLAAQIPFEQNRAGRYRGCWPRV
jgi:hypothetical protein